MFYLLLFIPGMYAFVVLDTVDVVIVKCSNFLILLRRIHVQIVHAWILHILMINIIIIIIIIFIIIIIVSIIPFPTGSTVWSL